MEEHALIVDDLLAKIDGIEQKGISVLEKMYVDELLIDLLMMLTCFQ